MIRLILLCTTIVRDCAEMSGVAENNWISSFVSKTPHKLLIAKIKSGVVPPRFSAAAKNSVRFRRQFPFSDT